MWCGVVFCPELWRVVFSSMDHDFPVGLELRLLITVVSAAGLICDKTLVFDY